MMRVTGQTVAAQSLQIIELPPHLPNGLGRVVVAAQEKLSDYLGVTAALLVEIDFAVLHAEHAEVRRAASDANLRQDLMH
jgi:hypothetical protein